jgi:hypothetical protein
MAHLITTFDIWRPGYGGAVVSIYVAGTTTLANVFKDEALTITADNPQTLSSMMSEDGTRSGKFAQPLYTAQSYYISNNGIENTGIIRPCFSSLSGVSASEATVRPTGSSYDSALDDVLGREVNVADYGVFVKGSGGVSATNNATLLLAIAALADGGTVKIPSGLYKVNAITVPANIVLEGQGMAATTLQSVIGSESFTLTGDRSGFKNLTLDGSSLSAGSVGIKSENNNYLTMQNVMVKRFETGFYAYGGKGFVFSNFSIDNVATAVKLFGEDNILSDVLWAGGIISTATTLGLNLSYEDKECKNINLIGVGFESCTEFALQINGAHNVKLDGCWWKSNTKSIKILDDTATLTPSTANQNKVIIAQFNGGVIDGGTFVIGDTADNVVLNNMTLKNLAFTLNTPTNNFLILKDCYEESGVTIAGETTKLLRQTSSLSGASFGVTTNNTATKTWSMELQPGQQVYLEAKVIAKGRNTPNRAMYHIGCGAYRAGAILAFDTQTANFTAGTILTGASSAATARIQSITDSGTTGSLVLTDIQGAFVDNEIITDNNGSPGRATANGTLSYQDVLLDSIGNENIRSIYESVANFAASFAASGPEVQLNVTGDSSLTIEWTVNVDVVST